MDEGDGAAFERLIEGASPEGRERLRRVQSELGLRENDGLWGVIGALEYYQTLYEATPARIEKVVDKALNAMEASARAASEYAAERTRAVLVDKVSDAVVTVANQTARKNTIKWGIGAVIVAGAICFALMWAAFDAGWSAGEIAEHARVTDAAARVSWINSAEGQAVAKMRDSGALDHLRRCDNPGWKAEGGVCYPYADAGGSIYGWRLP
jgi:hypothetical protein